MDRDGGSGAHVFGVIGPGIASGFVRYFGSFEVDRRVSGTVEPLWPFLTDPETPGRIVAGSQEENRVMLGLRCAGSSGGRRRGRRLLVGGRCLRPSGAGRDYGYDCCARES